MGVVILALPAILTGDQSFEEFRKQQSRMSGVVGSRIRSDDNHVADMLRYKTWDCGGLTLRLNILTWQMLVVTDCLSEFQQFVRHLCTINTCI